MSEAQFPGLTDIDLHISYSPLKLQIQLLMCYHNNGMAPHAFLPYFDKLTQK